MHLVQTHLRPATLVPVVACLLLALVITSVATAGTTFTVNSVADSDDGSCDPLGSGTGNQDCTLREAIALANALPGADEIIVSIPGLGVRTIAPVAALPVITEAVSISADASNLDASGWPLVRVDGAVSSALYGLEFDVGAPSTSSLSGLAFTRWTQGNGAGVRLRGDGLVTVRGTLIGTDQSGAAGLGNYGGIQVENASTIGGTGLGDRNVISGNQWSGVHVPGGAAAIQGNWIGVGLDGTTPLPNGARGVMVQAVGTLVGGTTPAAGNRIRSNTGPGVTVLSGSSGVTIRRNEIDSNSGVGIDLGGLDGVTANDAPANLDADTGPNGLQNFPVLSAATSSTVTGVLDSVASQTFTIDVYASAACDASGNGEGATHVGSFPVTTDASGHATFTAQALSGSAAGVVTATATGADGSTSEFSGCVTVSGGGGGGGPSGFVVNNVGDTSDGQCTAAHCTLREAIEAANAQAGADTISFDIDDPADTSAPYTIEPAAALPTVTGPVVIDGTTEPDYVASPVIELDGQLAPSGANGLVIDEDTGSTVRGLVINRFPGYAIQIADCGCASAGGNVIEGNFIGTDATGTLDRGNAGGVQIGFSNGTTIGGTTDEARNVISGNTFGVLISGAGATGNIVIGNYIGTDVTGALDLGNTSGVSISSGASGNTIGQPGAPNVISGNDGSGVGLTATDGNVVEANLIGTDATGTASLGNGLDGIRITTGTDNVIGGTGTGEGNTIAFNGADGVWIRTGGSGNIVRGNATFGNTGLGIDLEPDTVTANDAPANLDADTGPNGLQNFPVLSGATSSKVTGVLDSAAGQTYTIDVYASSTCDGSGNGEGATHVGSFPVTTDGAGHALFTNVALTGTAVGVVTTTATAPDGSTSEFSGCVTVAGDGEPTFTVNSTDDRDDGSCDTLDCTLREAIERANDEAGTDTIDFDLAGPAPHTIQLASELPSITEAVVIDGGSVPDCGGAPAVVLNGDNVDDGDGITIVAGPTTIRGLVVNGFHGLGAVGVSISGAGTPETGGNTVECSFIGTDADGLSAVPNSIGVEIRWSNDNVIGGTSPLRRNVISGNGDAGVLIIDNARFNLVQGNYVGTTVGGDTALPNVGYGVHVDGPSSNTIGGADPGAGNVISGNDGFGVGLHGASTTVEGNLIGIAADGETVLPNGDGVLVSGPYHVVRGNTISGNSGYGVRFTGAEGATWDASVVGNRIGTNDAGNAALPNGSGGVLVEAGAYYDIIGLTDEGNVISGNDGPGIRIDGAATDSISVTDNLIGVAADGTTPLPNAGAGISIGAGAASAYVTENVIAHNDADGIEATGGSGHVFNRNAVADNGGLGIDLDDDGVTANDVDDADAGTNDLQNFPLVQSATVSAGSTTITGTLDGQPGSYRVELFASDTCDTPGNGEGATYLDAATIEVADATDAPFAIVVGSDLTGKVITATATAGDGYGSSSEFSACRAVGDADSVDLSITKADSADPATAGSQLTYTLTVDNTGPGDATDVIVTDTLPAGVSFVSASDGGTEAGGIVTWNLGTIAVSDPAVDLTLVVAVDAQATALVNSAEVSTTSTDANDANDSASEPTAVEPPADLSWVVNKVADTDDGFCTVTNCTLREAINRANGEAGLDTIGFDFDDPADTTAPYAIHLTSGLPEVTEPVTIDATTEPDFAGTPVVELDGSTIRDTRGRNPGGNGLTIRTNGGTTVRGLAIGGFEQALVCAGVGVPAPCSGGLGLYLPGGLPGGPAGNVIEGNFIGTDASGTQSRPNKGGGVFVSTPDTRIGGVGPGQGNIVSANGEAVELGGGITLSWGSAGTFVEGNLIGTGPTGTEALGNTGPGVLLDNNTRDTMIGGLANGAGNTIVGNTVGVLIAGRPAADPNGQLLSNTISRNAISGNTESGIDLLPLEVYGPLTGDGVTANDLGDEDVGANDLQNYPVLTSVEAGASTTVAGSLNSAADSTYRLEFFESSACDGSGHGEGETYLGSADVTTNAGGNTTFEVTLTPTAVLGHAVTATATAPDGSTSEFSACETVAEAAQAADLSVVKTDSADPVSAGGQLTYTLAVDNVGAGNAADVVVTDTLPAGVTFVSASDGGTESGGVVTWSLGTVAPADTATELTLVVDVAAGQTAELSNTASVFTTSEDGNAANSSDTETTGVEDTTPPEIEPPTAPDPVEASGAGGAVVTFTPPTASDSVDGEVTVTCEPPSGSLFAIGETEVTCTATDAAGNESSVSFTVTVEDSTAPEIETPTAPPSTEAVGPDGAIVTFTPPTASDAVDGEVTVTCVPPSGSLFAIGETEVTCTATDAAGNESSVSFTVTVEDSTGPLIEPPTAPPAAEATGPDGANVTYTAPLATDTVDGDVAVTCEPPSGSLFAIGDTIVTCTATDDAGNESTAQLTVTIEDTTGPVIEEPAAPDPVVASDADGATVTYTAPLASDAVDGDVTVDCDPPSGSLFPVGDTLVTCSASDSSGNQSTVQLTVTVKAPGSALIPTLDPLLPPEPGVWSWGYGWLGSAGSSPEDGWSSRYVPGRVDVIDDAAAVATGHEHSLALDESGNVYSWGMGRYGELGGPPGDGCTRTYTYPSYEVSVTEPCRPVPELVPGLSGIVAIATSQHANLALDRNGDVYAWGRNLYGVLGVDPVTRCGVVSTSTYTYSDGTTSTNTSGYGSNSCLAEPEKIAGLSGIVAIATGQYHSLALDGDGNVYSWGYNYYGQLGADLDEDISCKGLYGFDQPGCRSAPALVPGLSGIVAIATGEYHNLALDGNGNVYSWGYNGWGQLGVDPADTSCTHTYPSYDGSSTHPCSPAPVLVPGLSGIVAVAASAGHSLALDGNGKVYAWGNNGSGQLGVDLADTSCTATDTFTSKSWGVEYVTTNATTTSCRPDPAQIPGLSGIAAITTGGSYWTGSQLALDGDGNVYSWGYNSPGQLGVNPATTDACATQETRSSRREGSDGTSSSWESTDTRYGGMCRFEPAPVPGLSDVTAIAVGLQRALAVGTASPNLGVKSFAVTVPAGGSVTSDVEQDGATPDDPVEVTVQSPNAGEVSFSASSGRSCCGDDFMVSGQTVEVEAPDASSAGDPIVLTFVVDVSIYPTAYDLSWLSVWRNGAAVEDCTGAGADPDPCVASRTRIGDGDVEVVVRTTHASEWTLGVAGPTADAGGPYEVPEGSSVTLAGSATGGIAPIAYAWEAVPGLGNPNDSSPTFTGADDGIVPIRLTVSDAAGNFDEATAEVTVTNVAPTVGPLTTPASVVQAKSSFELSASFTDPGVADSHTCRIDWGDGTSSTPAPAAGTCAANHAYTRPGFYTAEVTVSDDDGGRGSATTTIAVVNAASKLVQFALHYHWSGDPGYPDSMAYAVGQRARVSKGAVSTYRIHVLVANANTVPVTVKAEGGLAAITGATYAIVSASCGRAQARSNTHGNVVVWNASGDGNPKSAGFTVPARTACQLELEIRNAAFATAGRQPLTGHWSASQTGPGRFRGRTTTGKLAVIVVPPTPRG